MWCRMIFIGGKALKSMLKLFTPRLSRHIFQNLAANPSDGNINEEQLNIAVPNKEPHQLEHLPYVRQGFISVYTFD